MNWFKVYHEARNDRKLCTLTDSQHRVWFHLLCLAAEQNNDGVIEFRNHKVLAIEVSDSDTDKLQDTLTALSEIGIVELTENTVEFPGFKKRQAKPKDSPEANRERQKRFRERHNEEANNSVTDSNDRYGVTSNEEEKRTEEEQNREDVRAPSPPEIVNPKEPLAKAVLTATGKLSDFQIGSRSAMDYQDVGKILNKLRHDKRTVEDVEAAARFWPQHLRKPPDETQPPSPQQFLKWFDSLLARSKKSTDTDEPQFDIEELRARARNHHHANRN